MTISNTQIIVTDTKFKHFWQCTYNAFGNFTFERKNMSSFQVPNLCYKNKIKIQLKCYLEPFLYEAHDDSIDSI